MYQLLDVYAYVPPLAHAFQRHVTALGTPTNPYVYMLLQLLLGQIL